MTHHRIWFVICEPKIRKTFYKERFKLFFIPNDRKTEIWETVHLFLAKLHDIFDFT